MTLDELDRTLLRFGADLRRWPPAEAEAALRLMADDPSAIERIARFDAFERRVADAVRPPPFGGAETARVLAGVDAAEHAWRPARWFWFAGAGASALSFAAGALAALAIVPWQGDAGLPLSVLEIAAGQGDIGGLP